MHTRTQRRLGVAVVAALCGLIANTPANAGIMNEHFKANGDPCAPPALQTEGYHRDEQRPAVTFGNIRDVINDRTVDAWSIRASDFGLGLGDDLGAWAVSLVGNPNDGEWIKRLSGDRVGNISHGGHDDTGASTPTASQVPEPPMWALVGIAGLIGLGMSRRLRAVRSA